MFTWDDADRCISAVWNYLSSTSFRFRCRCSFFPQDFGRIYIECRAKCHSVMWHFLSHAWISITATYENQRSWAVADNGSLLKVSRIFSFFRSGGQAISTYSTLLSFETTLCEIENDGKVHYRRCTSVHWHTFVKCYQPLLRSILKQSWWQHI